MSAWRSVERAVAPDRDGVWRQIEIKILSRRRIRIASDRSAARPHQVGNGVDFELAVDSELRLWVRKFGSDQVFRQDEDVAGVSFVVLEDVTLGIHHEIRLVTRPADTRAHWVCECGEGQRAWVDRDIARRNADRHVAEAVDREAAAVALASQRRAEARAANEAELLSAMEGLDEVQVPDVG